MYQEARKVVESKVRRSQWGLIRLWIYCQCIGCFGEELKAGGGQECWSSSFNFTSSFLLSRDFIHWHSHSSFLPVLQRLLSYPGPSFMLCFLPRCSLITLLMTDSLTFRSALDTSPTPGADTLSHISPPQILSQLFLSFLCGIDLYPHYQFVYLPDCNLHF